MLLITNAIILVLFYIILKGFFLLYRITNLMSFQNRRNFMFSNYSSVDV